jgi:DNA invertase Pin-like site-specific DNA recombinase
VSLTKDETDISKMKPARSKRRQPLTDSKQKAYVAYYRVSTSRQGESGLGLEAQRSSVARYLAQAGPDAVLAAEFTEIESGKKTDRPQLAEALKQSARLGATLIIAKLDRLARNVHFISGLMEAATDFVACDMPHANRLTIHILAAMAEHEREMISARTKAALEQAKARGTQLGNPRWQESIHLATAARKKAPAAADLVRMVESYQAEGLSQRAMAARLNALGLRTPTGGQWYVSSIQNLLKQSIFSENSDKKAA